MLVFIFVVFLFTSLVAFTDGGATQDEPAVWIEISNINVEHGLSLLDGGDGQNEPADVGGSKCRVNVISSDPPSSYF
jgi:uncharacterized protein YaeQ